MAVVDLSKKVEEPEKKLNKTGDDDRVLQLQNYIDRIYISCNKAFGELPIELDESLWTEEQMGIYRYAVDQLAAAKILVDFKKHLETGEFLR